MHQRLNVNDGDRLVDVACGAGLAIELARARGASCAGIDASPRLIAVARDRNPDADVRVGDMYAMPWADESFDVATSFRGIWGTTPDALSEIHRVLAPGGRFGLTVWGHIKVSPGAWALAPFRLAASAKVENQAAMVTLGRPGVGEDLLARFGFIDVERVNIPFAWESVSYTHLDVYKRQYIALAGLWASPISGASMNPMRSLAPDLIRANFSHAWVYVVGPALGALVAVGFAFALRGRGGDYAAARAAEGTNQ